MSAVYPICGDPNVVSTFEVEEHEVDASPRTEPSDQKSAKAALAPLLAAIDDHERDRLAAEFAEFAERSGVGRGLIAEAGN